MPNRTYPHRYWVKSVTPSNSAEFIRVGLPDVFALTPGSNFIGRINPLEGNRIILPRVTTQGRRFIIAENIRRAASALITFAEERHQVTCGVLYLVTLELARQDNLITLSLAMGYTSGEMLPNFEGVSRDIGNSFDWLPSFKGDPMEPPSKGQGQHDLKENR
jgi:hypothetical protein